MTYENAIKKLEETVLALERGESSLDESLSLFEEGTKLAAFCSKTLDEAELKLTKQLLNKEEPGKSPSFAEEADEADGSRKG